MRIVKLTEESKTNILENLLKRSPNSYGQFELAVAEILENVKPDVDFENCETLIDDGLLDSFSILAIVGEINDEFDVEISSSGDVLTQSDFKMLCKGTLMCSSFDKFKMGNCCLSFLSAFNNSCNLYTG